MMEFEKQSQIMEMKDEVIQDTMEDMWDDEGEEEETDDIVNQVLDEIGINLETEVSFHYYYFQHCSKKKNYPRARIEKICDFSIFSFI